MSIMDFCINQSRGQSPNSKVINTDIDVIIKQKDQLVSQIKSSTLAVNTPKAAITTLNMSGTPMMSSPREGVFAQGRDTIYNEDGNKMVIIESPTHS